MKSVTNKTQRPVRVPLPRGRTLHLGPGQTGQIAPEAAEHPGLKKLVDADKIEISDEGTRPAAGAGGGRMRGARAAGHAWGGGGRRSGDR